jgi:DNA-binding MarR family transcriptional regulator
MATENVPSLTPTQIQALVVLMVEARELTNNELKELAGLTLTGSDNTKLETLGLVETDRSHRPFSHVLTDKGWHVVREIHTTTPPKAGGSAAKSLFTVLANVHRSLDRLQTSHAEFFKRTSVDARQVTTESAVRAAYGELARAPGEWVGLAVLRERLAGIDRKAVDETLRAMAHQDGVRIIPIADTKNLDAHDRAAALRIGSQDNHVIAIELP